MQALELAELYLVDRARKPRQAACGESAYLVPVPEGRPARIVGFEIETMHCFQHHSQRHKTQQCPPSESQVAPSQS